MEPNVLMIRCLMFLQQMAVIADRPIAGCGGIHGVNIALKKPAQQSSRGKGGSILLPAYDTSGKEVDGQANNTDRERDCIYTSAGLLQISNAWWEVDLGSQYILGHIRMLSRASSVDQLHDVKIDVFEKEFKSQIEKMKSKTQGKDNSRGKKHCVTQVEPTGPGWLNLSCESPVTGRYVRIKKKKDNQTDVLTLCEVEIYEAIVPGRCQLFKAQGDNETLMALSTLHCAFVCGRTTFCKGFDVIEKDERQTRWEREQAQLEDAVSFFRKIDKN